MDKIVNSALAFIENLFNSSLALFERNIKDVRQDISKIKIPEIQKVEVLNQIEIPPFPDIPEPKEVIFPSIQKVEVMNQMEIPEADMSETNSLLQQLIDKKDGSIDIKVSLKLK